MLRPWPGVLDGEESRTANRVVAEVAQALASENFRPKANADFSDALLASERALLFSYLERCWPMQGYGGEAAWWIDLALSTLERAGHSGLGLHGGTLEIAWVVSHLLNSGHVSAKNDPLAAFDEDVTSMVESSPWVGEYDLIGGLAGLAVYLLERLPRPAAARALESVVARFSELSLSQVSGVTWHTPPEHLPAWQRDVAPQGYFNFGVAHGVPAVLVVLAGALERGVRFEGARGLLEGGVSWLLRHESHRAGVSSFPSWITAEGEVRPARFGWCYGDIGVAAALLNVGCAVRNDAYVAEAVRIARSVALRPAEECAVSEPGLCHGAAGVASIYMRFHHQTGIEEFSKNARAWALRILELRLSPMAEAAGFWSVDSSASLSAPVAREDSSFLTGAVGGALSLLAASGACEPSWDRLLGLSLGGVFNS